MDRGNSQAKTGVKGKRRVSRTYHIFQSMTSYHKILQRQIKNYLKGDLKIGPDLDKLFQTISCTYEKYEKDRQLLKRSMDTNFNELYDSNEKLSNEYKQRDIVLDKLKQAIAELKIQELPDTLQDIEENNMLVMVDLLQEKIRMTKEFEEELRVSRLKFQAIVENTADIIWSVDEDFRLNIFNSFFRKKTIAKYNIEPVLGDKLSNIMPPEEYKELEGFLLKAKEGERFIIEEVLNKKNGSSRYFETSFNPIQAENKITGVSVFSRDITPRKEDEKSKNQMLSELQSMNEELEQIAYITSHDLKTPLRSIGSIASWIKTDYQHVFDELSKEQIDILIKRVERLYNLIDSISLYMSINSSDEEERQMVNPNSIISKIVNTIQIPEHITVKTVRPLPRVMGIKTHIYIVFEQLIKNAVFFMDKKEGKIQIDFREKGRNLEFSVSDNGPGIEEKYHQKIFKIFQTLKSKDELETNGIGLAMVKKIVKIYGGEISVDSASGQGSTFSFSFNYGH